jgi:hypothetical protein
MGLYSKGWLLVLFSTDRLKWKRLTVTDTQAYDGKGTFMAVKSFIVLSPSFCFNCQISYW